MDGMDRIFGYWILDTGWRSFDCARNDPPSFFELRRAGKTALKKSAIKVTPSYAKASEGRLLFQNGIEITSQNGNISISY